MNCDEASVLVHALADAELDAGNAREVEAHIARCAACAREFAAATAMQQALRRRDLKFTAPASLRARIEATVPVPRAAQSRRFVLKGFAFGSLASAIAASGAGIVLMKDAREDRVLGEALSAHLRSLQADHLTDVVSTNQHTVKPWFNGRIDLAPPVVDLTMQGFTLVGGRLDFIDGKPVAALVYRRRAHIINLFIGQGFGPAPPTPTLSVVQGYNALRWNARGLDLLAVSDLSSAELEDFGKHFASRTGGTPGAG